MRKINDFTPYVGILPYSSEIFGVYQTLIGWKSRRKRDWIDDGARGERGNILDVMVKYYRPTIEISFNSDFNPELKQLEPGELATSLLLPQNRSLVLDEIAKDLRDRPVPIGHEWDAILNRTTLKSILYDRVFPRVKEQVAIDTKNALNLPAESAETPEALRMRRQQVVLLIQSTAKERLSSESAIAGALIGLVAGHAADALVELFYSTTSDKFAIAWGKILDRVTSHYDDPYLTFDPKKDAKDVAVSPLGIVHLFRQFFFEFDTFLGTPVGHVWLSPGSTVELTESSTRRILTEKTIEQELESTLHSERATTDQDEISDAVKQDNRNDTKMGVTSTVNQSWCSGNASATASLNIDLTQQTAREQSHKRMRLQSEKLSSEIRQNYKTSFKTVTESTDTSSKRYLLSNTTNELINYELRRKMRQVCVQVQDMGTYLCWETFIDEPGHKLGLGQLVHLAQPGNLAAHPNQKEIEYPPRMTKTFQVNVAWDFDNTYQYNDSKLGFKVLATLPLPVQPDAGYKVANPDGYVDVNILSRVGEDARGQYETFRCKLLGSNSIQIGIDTKNGIKWDKRIDFVVGGAIDFVPTPEKIKDIDLANQDIIKAKDAATRKDDRQYQEEFVKAAKDRIKLASQIKARKFEDLREEERTVVYRGLIESLMTDSIYLDTSPSALKTRHVLSELINSIFDVDKMLYFVAPEWWKPRTRMQKPKGATETDFLGTDKSVSWPDQERRKDNYYITEDSTPAPLGASLGWLLQLDGDNLRNAFLNAPWVKAVIPVRPEKEQAAIAWLQNTNVEGADGLDASYVAPSTDLMEIRKKLLEVDPADPVATHAQVTLADALRFLCQQVSSKHKESRTVDIYPKDPGINDDLKVSATPVEKVYEHGFYPLKGGFRVNPSDPTRPDPSGQNFQLFDQWLEVLPTDQIVPVPVKYDSKTGQQQ
jgi:hypothetical protein